MVWISTFEAIFPKDVSVGQGQMEYGASALPIHGSAVSLTDPPEKKSQRRGGRIHKSLWPATH